MHELPGFVQIMQPLSTTRHQKGTNKKIQVCGVSVHATHSSALIASSMHSSASTALIELLLYAFHAKN